METGQFIILLLALIGVLIFLRKISILLEANVIYQESICKTLSNIYLKELDKSLKEKEEKLNKLKKEHLNLFKNEKEKFYEESNETN